MRMSMSRFSAVVDWSRRYGAGEITLLGGEPSLHTFFVDMVNLTSTRGLGVRVVTNGAGRFRRLLSDGMVGSHNLSRVAVSLDTMDEAVQDRFRGPGAWRDAMATIGMLRQHGVPFDINVTAVRAVLDDVDELIDFAERGGCRRVNIHWPSSMGIGSGLAPEQIPLEAEWKALVRWVASREEGRPGFFVEVERGFLSEGEALTGCALADFSNLQVLPDGRAYRCGLLVDQPDMASLSMADGQLRLIRPRYGEELLRSSMPPSCNGCPVMLMDGRRACIYDKIRSTSVRLLRLAPMRSKGLVIFDVFNTLVTAHPGSQDTFLAGLRTVGLKASRSLLRDLQAACEGLDHCAYSDSRPKYVGWALDTLSKVGEAADLIESDLACRVVPALEQLHQAPMVPLPGAETCLKDLKAAGFTIAVCSNWGWDLCEDLEYTGLAETIDVFVSSAETGFRKPHLQIYRSTLHLTGFGAEETVFVGDSMRADVLGPQRIGIRSILLSTEGLETFEGERVRSLGEVSRMLIRE
jgi:putative hydrolase of the HAD superfamily